MVAPQNMTSSLDQTYDVDETSINPYFMAVYSLVFLVGLLLNGFTLKVYLCRDWPRVSNSLMVYLKNLTAADFLLCLCLPLRITYYASSSPIIRRLYCSFGASALFINMYASILFMGYIAANRYLRIIHPSGTHMLQTVQTARIISVITWVFLLAPTVVYVIIFFSSQKPLTFNPSRCVHLFTPSVSLLFRILHTFSAFIFLLVFISLVFFYYSISRRVLEAQQTQLASSGTEKLLKSRRNMLVLVSIFCVCFVPYHLVRLPFAFLWSDDSVGPVLFYLKEVTTMVSVFNICLDPVVYFFLSNTFWDKVRKARAQHTTRNKENESRRDKLDIITLEPVTSTS
ncbi:P2Y purinoceptor 14-like [Oreochromis aureus]|uniref:P2Y purinoceptor 14-like n=1 Tax=Oreochromis aureus TaxID=47969 RepID=UPI0019545AA7|nr:P2Y purinoceptor 14-like [Oreochromis aureus]XP_039464249.1 P2Y purinoceptor 14-like [Oreochromis aureus]